MPRMQPIAFQLRSVELASERQDAHEGMPEVRLAVLIKGISDRPLPFSCHVVTESSGT